MHFVIANFWSAPRNSNRPGLRTIRIRRPGPAIDNIPVITPIPVDLDGGTLALHDHLTANDPLTPRKSA